MANALKTTLNKIYASGSSVNAYRSRVQCLEGELDFAYTSAF